RSRDRRASVSRRNGRSRTALSCVACRSRKRGLVEQCQWRSQRSILPIAFATAAAATAPLRGSETVTWSNSKRDRRLPRRGCCCRYTRTVGYHLAPFCLGAAARQHARDDLGRRLAISG